MRGMRQGPVVMLLLAAALGGASLIYLLDSSEPPGALTFLVRATATPFQPRAATGTPFLPVGSTLTPLPTALPATSPAAMAASPFLWHSLDLGDDRLSIQLVIQPPGQVNHGRPVTVDIHPGSSCEYRDHHACVIAAQDGSFILATVHSGVGGEGQALRGALEGTGINRAGFSLERIQANLEAVQGAPVSLRAGDQQVDGVQVLAAVRVPPEKIEAYFAVPVDEALAELADASPALRGALESGQPLLIIETCGWRHPAERWAPSVSDTTGSVYLLVIG